MPNYVRNFYYLVGSGNQTEPEPVYLSDIDWVSASNGWGQVERDGDVNTDAPNDGRPILLGGITYPKGLGVHAFSEIVYNVNQEYSRFESVVGISDYVTFQGSVIFRILGDNQELYNSGLIGVGDTPIPINIPIADVSILRLVTEEAINGNGNDHGIWADAKIFPINQGNSANLENPIELARGYDHPGNSIAEVDYSELTRLQIDSLIDRPVAGNNDWSGYTMDFLISFGNNLPWHTIGRYDLRASDNLLNGNLKELFFPNNNLKLNSRSRIGFRFVNVGYGVPTQSDSIAIWGELVGTISN